MELLTPGTGLIIWQTIIFLLLLGILSRFAWKPILSSLKIREDSIQEALDAADQAREEMARLKSDNEQLLAEARKERDVILQEARKTAGEITESSKEEARKEAEKIVEEAKVVINREKKQALTEVKNQVAELSLQLTEKILKKTLQDDKAQQSLISEYIKDIKLN